MEGMVVGKKLGYNFYLMRRDIASGRKKIKKKRECVRRVPFIPQRVKCNKPNLAFLFDLRRLDEPLNRLRASQ